MTTFQWLRLIGGLLISGIALSGCIPPQPKQSQDICDIFQQYPEWYWEAKKTEEKWGAPVPVQMAIMYAESGFQATAEPLSREHILRRIVWKPISSAYGYCQALRPTWQCYEEETGKQVDRNQFASASDFIGWYANQAKQIANIQPTDAYNLYLAYHEGLGGYHAKSYWHKPWLMNYARQVEARALTYRTQLETCEGQIPKASILEQTSQLNIYPYTSRYDF